MTASTTSNPSALLPGQVLGKPIRLPHFMLCTQGEVFCGRVWTANTARDLPVKMAERRKHEDTCQGGLLTASSLAQARETGGV